MQEASASEYHPQSEQDVLLHGCLESLIEQGNHHPQDDATLYFCQTFGCGDVHQGLETRAKEQWTRAKRDAHFVRVGDALGTYRVQPEPYEFAKTAAVSTNRPCVKCKTVKMVSVIFGKSKIVADWCPECHGLWLDRDEFEQITEYLKRELAHEKPKEIEHQVVADMKRVWAGGPESGCRRLWTPRLRSLLSSALRFSTIPCYYVFAKGFSGFHS